jgi:hypothetical protein
MNTIRNLLARIFGTWQEPDDHAKTPLDRIHAQLGWPEIRNPTVNDGLTEEQIKTNACIQQIQNNRAGLETAFLMLPKEMRDAIIHEINWRLKG